MPNLLQALSLGKRSSNLEIGNGGVLNVAMCDPLKKKEITKSIKSLNDLLSSEPELKSQIMKLFKDKPTIRNEYWKEHYTLPDSLISKDDKMIDNYSYLSSFPLADFKQIKTLADKLSMLILPEPYIDMEEALKIQPNADSLLSVYHSFKEWIKDDKYHEFDFYVLCPIDYFHYWKYVTSEFDLPIYHPESLNYIFDVIDIMTPTQRNLYKMAMTNKDNIETLKTEMDNNFNTIDKKLKNISARLNRVELELIQQKAQIQNLNAGLQSAMDKVEKLERTRHLETQAYSLIDPILFVVPKGYNIINGTEDEKTPVICGLCWGEDISQVFFDAHGIHLCEKNDMKIDFSFLNKTFKLNRYLYLDNKTKEAIESDKYRCYNIRVDGLTQLQFKKLVDCLKISFMESSKYTNVGVNNDLLTNSNVRQSVKRGYYIIRAESAYNFDSKIEIDGLYSDFDDGCVLKYDPEMNQICYDRDYKYRY
jgi:hypothetical protein